MTHVLCLADLSLKRNSLLGTNEDYTNAADTSIDASARSVVLFVREDNKNCSFALEHPFSLICDSERKHPGGGGGLISSDATVNDDSIKEQVTCDRNHASFDAKRSSAKAGEDDIVFAMAYITSCIISNDEGKQSRPVNARSVHGTFLFGGFELIANVKVVEVYVSKSTDALKSPEPESYLTTCKGIPMRDLPPLPASFVSIDKTNFYKFILVVPGGAKPMERVRLKFVGSDTSPVGNIIVRTLKVKCRLPDSTPASKPTQESTTSHVDFPNKVANGSQAILSIERHDNVISQTTLMKSPGRNGSDSIDIPSKTSHQQVRQVQMHSFIQRTHQQHQLHQQDINQAEIMNSIAGLGIFFKHSEERTMAKLDTMLTGMEMRITERIDAIAERLDVIEKILIHKTNGADAEVSHIHKPNGADAEVVIHSTSTYDTTSTRL